MDADADQGDALRDFCTREANRGNQIRSVADQDELDDSLAKLRL
ncbi:hypothetical protein [Streptomyces sp. 150FB]|nr:hypothetical protein [Streptomyces sp. 150FB]